MWLYVTWTVPSARVMVANVPAAPLGPWIIAPLVAARGGQLVAQVPVHVLMSGESFVKT
jgi:hypothetical protein